MTWSLSRRENWIMVCEGGLNEIIQEELIQHAWEEQSLGHTNGTLSFSHTHTRAHIHTLESIQCELFCIHLLTDAKRCKYQRLHMQMHRSTISSRPTFITSTQPWLVALLFAEKRISALLLWHCLFRVFLCCLPSCAFTVLVSPPPQIWNWGLIPRMSAISLTTLQHI